MYQCVGDGIWPAIIVSGTAMTASMPLLLCFFAVYLSTTMSKFCNRQAGAGQKEDEFNNVVILERSRLL